MTEHNCELTVEQTHQLFLNGELTCEELVSNYLERIERYDSAGPELNAIITINDDAIDRASQLDELLADDGLVGPLHGIPVLVKDQVQTADVVTTYGSEAFEGFVPTEDAEIVSRVREAGGVILAKTNLPDWGSGFVGYSSAGGQTKNPYGLDRDSGGSSAGTGTGIAANLGLVGIGSDTGGSVRVPASCCNLYGLRVTTGLIPRTGMSAMISRQDTAGPMARTLEDMVRLLDVLVGFDPDDDATGTTVHAPASSYTSQLDTGSLDGAHIGVLREAFGGDETEAKAAVTAVVETAIDRMETAGAEIVDPVSIPNLDDLIDTTSLYAYQANHDITSYLSELEGSPVDSVEELYEAGRYHESLELFEKIAGGPDDPTDVPAFWERTARQDQFRRAIEYAVGRHEIDALVFPDVQVPPPKYEQYHTGELVRANYPTNTFIASQSGCPALSMPAGVTDGGLPVGIELMGVPYSEPTLISLAAGYDAVTDVRQPPETAPPMKPE